jgi:hypothetical protein
MVSNLMERRLARSKRNKQSGLAETRERRVRESESKQPTKSNRDIILDQLFLMACGEYEDRDPGILKAIELYCRYSGEFNTVEQTDEQLVIVVGDLDKLDTSNLKGGPDEWDHGIPTPDEVVPEKEAEPEQDNNDSRKV